MHERSFPLPADVQYVLDGACEEHHILGCHHYALDTYGDTKTLDAIMEQRTGLPRLKGLHDMGASLACYADEIIAAMPDREREWMSSLAYAHVRKIIRDYAEFLAGWHYTDQIKGGCAISMHYRRMRKDQTGTPLAMRRLRGTNNIRRYVKSGLRDYDWLRAVIRSALALPLPQSLTPGEAFNKAMEIRIRRHREEQYRVMAEIKASAKATAKKVPYAIVRKKERDRRKVIRKAAVLAAGLLGASTVSAFARGEPVVIAGPEVAFSLQSRGGLARLGHDSVAVTVLGPDGKPASGLCVYHDATPALDQLTAFALRIQSGEEREIIKAGNLYNVQAGALDMPALAEKAKARSETPFSINARDERFRLYEEAYIAEFRHVYEEAVAVQLLGRAAKHVMRLT